MFEYFVPTCYNTDIIFFLCAAFSIRSADGGFSFVHILHSHRSTITSRLSELTLDCFCHFCNFLRRMVIFFHYQTHAKSGKSKYSHRIAFADGIKGISWKLMAVRNLLYFHHQQVLCSRRYLTAVFLSTNNMRDYIFLPNYYSELNYSLLFLSYNYCY